MNDSVIFTPLEFRHLTIKNRVLRSSLAGRFNNYDGTGTRIHINWDLKFAKGGVGAIKAGSLLEMHVRIEVSPGERNSSRLHLRFSGGFGGSVLMPLLAVCCLAAFGWAVRNLTAGAAWDPLDGAALLSISVPGLLVLAMRSDAPNDQKVLWEFVADQVDGGSGATPG